MSEPINITDSLEVKDILATTQTIRKELVKQMVKNGVPDDRRDARLLLETLRDMDTTALTAEKNTIEQEAQNSASRISENVAKIVELIGKDPFREKEPIAGSSMRVKNNDLLPDISIEPALLKTEVEDIEIDLS